MAFYRTIRVIRVPIAGSGAQDGGGKHGARASAPGGAQVRSDILSASSIGDQAMSALFQSNLKGLPLLGRGKVRDLYRVDDRHLLVVATDRLSAFDVVLPQPIPGKGEVLTRLSNFWFARTAGLIPNHLSGIPVAQVVTDRDELETLGERAVVVRRLQPLPVEAIARGYLIGSGWKDYQASGAVCGIALPAGLRQADRLPEPIFTPSTKAEAGTHDENVDLKQVSDLIGRELAQQVRDMTLRIYTESAAYALERGIIVADTKLEFGLDEQGQLHLIDEVLTPDSSRFWPADQYRPGIGPPSFDKQFVRDYLETLDWDKTAPGPDLPAAIVARTAAKYREAEERLTGG
jgi:phosphoribosylaminoimidazole-succinocarboxamide synthase